MFETQWITHPNYPGWRKRRLVSPDGQRMAATYYPWERIPGSDPSLPPPPEPGLRTLPNNRPTPPNSISPPWGRPNFIPRRNLPNIPNLPNKPLPRMYNMPELPIPNDPRMYNMPEPPINKGRQYNMPSLYKKTLEHMVPLGRGKNIGGGINPPWANMRKPVVDMTRDITIPPARRVNTPGVFNPATGQNRVAQQGPIWPPGLMREEMEDSFPPMGGFGESMAEFMFEAGYPESDQPGTPEYQEIMEFEARDDGIVEPPKGSMEYARKMHDIQEAMLNGADFGYEDYWPQSLGVTNEMIDKVMLTPIEAMVFAMQNPTEMVLKEFENYYGWPINVHSEALREHINNMGKYIKEYN
tara:strand:+ start:2647 stop:3711 length:1065 start_codon:yes stop_codon:yes gene_type:complete